MLRVGLTGGIGTGKSTVLQMLLERGASTVDADAIARSVSARGGAAIPAIAQHFGSDFIAADGGLDRVRMRERAYRDPQARQQLEAIIHPLVGREIALRVDTVRSAGSACVVLDIPLLVESGRWRSQLDQVLVVDCSPETQIARVTARSGLKPGEVEAIIAAQASRQFRLAAADQVICNEGLPLEQLRAEVAQVAGTFGL
jgi:dephospho-CoA kinase